MKILILFFLLFFTSTTQQRGVGTIRVNVFKNEDCNLNSNYQLDSAEIIVNNSRLDKPKRYTCYNLPTQDRPYFESGKYDVTYINPDGDNIVIRDVEVSAEKITFVDLLVEPNCDHNFKEKRRRRKKYTNYKR